MNPPTISKTYQIKVLEKTFKILSLFDQKGKELTTSEIHNALSLNKATTIRILNMLEGAGYMERDPETLKYRLGFKLFFMGSLVEGYAELKRLVHPFLVEFNKECDETIQLAVLYHGAVLYLDKLEGRNPLRVVSQVGQKLPAHCTGLGKVLLASLPEQKLDQIIKKNGLERLTRNTITDPVVLKIELKKVRRQGYATDKEEIHMGLKCIAVPLTDSNNNVIAAISIAAPKERFGNREINNLIPLIKKMAAKISEVLKLKMLENVLTI